MYITAVSVRLYLCKSLYLDCYHPSLVALTIFPTSTSVTFSEPWGKRFNDDIPFRTDFFPRVLLSAYCPDVDLCISSYLTWENVSLIRVMKDTDLWLSCFGDIVLCYTHLEEQ